MFTKLFIALQSATPVPKDIPLPLPLPEWLLVTILVISFLVHILFVNLMVGGSLLTLWSQIKGLKNKEYDTLAHEIAATITVNKSIAVVMGIAPLLSINVLYTIYFYSANALTGLMWIAVIPLVTVAFLLTYLHKYTWKLLENNKAVHISILAVAVAIFLFIPFIFLTNINLMLFPEKWALVKGFFSAMILPNVFPRYFHFIFASLSITGLFLHWYMGRKNYPFETIFPTFTRYELKKKGYSLALVASVIQFLIGPLVLLTLPSKGLGWNLILIIFTGAAIALPAMWMMWKGIQGDESTIDKDFKKVLVLMTITVLFMGSGRQVYRSNALEKHRELVKLKTEEFQKIKKQAIAKSKQAQAETNNADLSAADKGKAVFNQYCTACHKVDAKLVGPPVLEMAKIYKGNIADLQQWIKKPGKKRPDYPQMPGFESQLSQQQLDQLGEYILTIK
ncbi:c-type cytochrome [Flavobacterium pectinovorum]|uniref:c-type cytochrome n=1 Tax=Flavobacterium pectinovorum TaxID=29533 RepID=UPI00265F8545|nr:c-type cytochrome [Flavobacterium pectinovorum]WKL47880.1 c-type cytochrome [Flavobacterium pectinovorum]